MSRKETTAELSAVLESQVLCNLPFWAAEVEFGRYDAWSERDYRPDYMAFEPKGGSRSIASVEAGTLHVFEVKSCYADLTSGHGMNRIGDVNWLVMPFELYENMVDNRQNLPSGWNACVFGYPKEGEFTWNSTHASTRTGRKVPLSQAFWCMLKSPRNSFTAYAHGGLAPFGTFAKLNDAEKSEYEKFRKLAGLEAIS